MVVRLDPRYPIVWRSPTSLQIGVAAPRAVLANVSTADERMISALVEGISESGLGMLGRAAGASDADVAALLRRVRPALTEPTLPSRRVLVSGAGPTAATIAQAIAARGHSLVTERPDFVVITAHYVVPPELHGSWLRRDVPHLAVVVLDSGVEVGPIIEPGTGPCLYCGLGDATEADPAWPAMAAQLHGVRSAADTPTTAGEVAALVSRLVAHRLDGGPTARFETLTLDLDSGVVSSRVRLRRDDCGCAGLRDRTETDSPGGAPDATQRRLQPRPTTGITAGALA
jgi:hypothetical protein